MSAHLFSDACNDSARQQLPQAGGDRSHVQGADREAFHALSDHLVDLAYALSLRIHNELAKSHRCGATVEQQNAADAKILDAIDELVVLVCDTRSSIAAMDLTSPPS